MKALGIVRKTDDLGRFSLPASLRRELGIELNDSMEIYLEDQVIILKKHVPTCIFCDNPDNIEVFKEKDICLECRNELKKI